MKLTSENYFSSEANQLYMSASQYRDFLECEAMALAKLRGPLRRSRRTTRRESVYQ